MRSIAVVYFCTIKCKLSECCCMVRCASINCNFCYTINIRNIINILFYVAIINITFIITWIFRNFKLKSTCRPLRICNIITCCILEILCYRYFKFSLVIFYDRNILRNTMPFSTTNFLNCVSNYKTCSNTVIIKSCLRQ